MPPCPCPAAEAPKGLGTKLPSKRDKKDKAAAGGEAAGEGGEGGATPAAAAAAKKEKEAVPMQRVEAKSWEVGGWLQAGGGYGGWQRSTRVQCTAPQLHAAGVEPAGLLLFSQLLAVNYLETQLPMR